MTKKHIKLYTLILITFLSFSLLMTGCDNTQGEPANATAEETSSKSPATTNPLETTSPLPEGVAYIMEDGTSIFIDDLLSPIQLYNNICTTGNADNFNSVYPQEVIDYILQAYGAESTDSYALQIYDLYHKTYNDNFSMTNEYKSCQLLTQSQLEDFSSFYFEHIGTELTPDYGFIVESEYSITYIDENGEEQSDSETDYYIAYSLNRIIYLDYYYIDTLDL